MFTIAALCALFAMTLPGCVLVPIPTALADPEPFTPERLAPIQLGRTTQDEVRAMFGNWTYETDDGIQTAHIVPQISDDGRLWVFGLPRQVGDIAYAGLVAYFPVILPVLVGKQDNYENYWVVVEFNDDATVSSIRIAKENAPCVDGGVCYRDGQLLLIAGEAVSRAARSNGPPNDACVLFSYADDALDVPLTISYRDRTDRLASKVAFLRTELPPGHSTVCATGKASEPQSEAISTVDVDVVCAANEVLYIELSRRHGRIIAKPTNESTGARALAKRHIVERAIQTVTPPRVQAPGGVACSGAGRSDFESSHAVTRRSR